MLLRLGLGYCDQNIVVFWDSFVPGQRITEMVRGPEHVTYKEHMRGAGLFSLMMRRP